ncbi:MAG: hypothetical protein ACU0DK_08800 [Pseudooceanicola sp.]
MTELTHARAMLLIDRLSRVLRDEIAAIGQGHLAQVEELFPRKAQLLQEIEEAFQNAGGLLDGEEPPAVRLREKLSELRRLIQADLAVLQRMTEATGAVAREIERIRDRHSLNGLYDRDGTHPAQGVARTQRLDQSI